MLEPHLQETIGQITDHYKSKEYEPEHHGDPYVD